MCIRAKPKSAPRTGETTMKAAVLPKNDPSSTETRLAFVTAAPAKPPRSACDDDDGRPHHHVSRFQMIAPRSAERRTLGVTNAGSTPFAIFFATVGSNTRK